MVPVYLQSLDPKTRTLRGYAAETAREQDIIERFCLGQSFIRIVVNRSERSWVIVVLDREADDRVD